MMLKLSDFKTAELWRALASEFLGTFFLVLVACGSGQPFCDDGEIDIVKISLCAGLTLAAMIQLFGRISGGHVNPAVTLAMLVTQKMGPIKAALYAIAQCAGAISGSALLLAITPAYARGTLGANELMNGTDIVQGVVVEFIMTTLLIFVICAATDERNKAKSIAPLATGLTVTTAHLFGIPYTGCSMNPARSLGPAVITHHWNHHWIFWLGPFMGAIAAGGVYHYILSPPDRSAEDNLARANKALGTAAESQSERQPMHKGPVFSLADLRSIDDDLESAVYINNANDDPVEVAVGKVASEDVIGDEAVEVETV